MIIDENGNVDFQEWTVPEKWDDVTLRMYSDIERYYAEHDGEFNTVEVLHILCNRTEDEVKALPLDFTEKLMQRLAFLQEPPEVGEPSNAVEIDGERYRVATEKTMRFGEYAAADTLLRSDKHNYAALLGIILRKEGEAYDSHYEQEVYDDRVRLFESQPVTKFLPLIGFFLRSWALTEGISQVYSAVREEIDLLVKSIESSQKVGAIRKRYLSWRLNRLRKSLE